MRLRCWYEVVIGTAKGRRIVLREEGLRGDDARTTSRAIGRWRKLQGKGARAPVAVREFRIAKRQPRPCPRTGRRAVQGPLRLAAMQGPCRTGMQRMTGRGGHEGGGSVFSCVVPYRFRDLAGVDDRARAAKELLIAPALVTS